MFIINKQSIQVVYTIIFFLFTSIVMAQTNDPLFATPDTKYDYIRVERVASTNIIYLENGERVQLIGLKALETPKKKTIKRDQYGFVIDDTKPFDTLEERAFNFMQDLLTDKFVRLEFDRQKFGEGNILLAYVYLADTNIFVNGEILTQGYASLSLQAPNMKHADILRPAYQIARSEQRGIHAE